ARQAQAFVQQNLDRLDQVLQALRVVLLTQRLNVVVGRCVPDANHVRRDPERGADILSRQLQLLDQLGVNCVLPQGLKLQPVPQDSDPSRVRPGIVLLPVRLQPSGSVIRDVLRGGQYAPGSRTV